MPAPHTPPFPFKSLLLFVAGAVVLRLLSMVGWVFFPGDGVLPQLGRILIPLCFSVALVVLNQRLLARDGFAPDALGLKLTPARARVVLASTLLIAVIFAAMAAGLCLLVPFHYERGPLRLAAFGLRGPGRGHAANIWVRTVAWFNRDFAPVPDILPQPTKPIHAKLCPKSRGVSTS